MSYPGSAGDDSGSTSHSYIFTSESVSEGHPDKVADTIADAVLDTCLAADANSRVACEVLVKSGDVVLAGEITSSATFDHEQLVRQVIRRIGYTDPAEEFSADKVRITSLLTRQAAEINAAVTKTGLAQGAGDQGIMFGYATDETDELMPLPILLAHRLAWIMAEDRRDNVQPWLRPDSKTQVSVQYVNDEPAGIATVLVSTQHAAGVEQGTIAEYVRESLSPRALGAWHNANIEFIVNPSGSFEQGGPSADAGVTGRKIIVDTYGGAAKHGGGAFSGKDPSKVDRSGAYFCRYVARQVVKQGLAKRAEVQVGYAIGRAEPVSVKVDTFGTGDPNAAAAYVREFDFRPAAIIQTLDLVRPIYSQTTNYGHFGKPGLPWEA